MILINRHGKKDDRINIPAYKTYQQNVSDEPLDGIAIAVRRSLRHRTEDDYLSETLAVEVDTMFGSLLIAA